MTDYKDWNKSELYELATDMGIEGRSSMSKPQLIKAIQKAEGPDSPPSEPERSEESDTSKPERPSKALLTRQAHEQARVNLRHARLSYEAARSQTLHGGDPSRQDTAYETLQEAEKAYTKAAKANA